MATRIPKPKPEPRKRPRQSRSEATYAAILEAAARILEESGEAALTTNAVATRAGVSIGSLYQYFGSKTAILAELTRRERQAFEARLLALAPGLETATLSEAIDLLIPLAVAQQLERPALARALDHLEPSLALDAETVAMGRRIARLIEATLTRNGVADPEEAARDVVALTKGLIDAAGLAGETDRASVERRARRAALGYLSAAGF